jgi:hypothetical protein
MRRCRYSTISFHGSRLYTIAIVRDGRQSRCLTFVSTNQASNGQYLFLNYYIVKKDKALANTHDQILDGGSNCETKVYCCNREQFQKGHWAYLSACDYDDGSITDFHH